MTQVVAYGTRRTAYFDLFMASCRRYGIEPVVLGWEQPWVGFGRKTMDIRRHIDGLPADELVLSVDPFDVVFLAGLDEVEAKYRARPARFLCGALKLGALLGSTYRIEFNRTGRPTPTTPSGYDYCNTGTWIATAGVARAVIDTLVTEHGMRGTDMDQQLITGMQVCGHPLIELEWRCDIFHNLLFRDFVTRRANLDDLRFVDGRVENIATGTRPSILHASGNARMEPIARALGYPAELARPVCASRNFAGKAFFHVGRIMGSLVSR